MGHSVNGNDTILPLYNLWILCTNYDVAHGWKTGNMNCLLSKAKVSKIQAQCESECMANVGRHFRRMQIRAEEWRKEQGQNLTNEEVYLKNEIEWERQKKLKSMIIQKSCCYEWEISWYKKKVIIMRWPIREKQMIFLSKIATTTQASCVSNVWKHYQWNECFKWNYRATKTCELTGKNEQVISRLHDNFAKLHS